MRKLRLLLFEECDRNCQGCCNHDWALQNLEVEKDFSDYDRIFLTGGEPMLKIHTIMDAIDDIREQTGVPIYLYTAKVTRPVLAKAVLDVVDGMTLTLHDQDDVYFYYYFNIALSDKIRKEKSLRLNVFKGIDISKVITDMWVVKENIVWKKDAPLPDGEVFKRYKEI